MYVRYHTPLPYFRGVIPTHLLYFAVTRVRHDIFYYHYIFAIMVTLHTGKNPIESKNVHNFLNAQLK